MPKTKEMIALEAKIAELEALLAKKSTNPGVTLKVSAKGAVSVYGMGRFPVTLYREQMVKFGKAVFGVEDLTNTPVGKFIAANDAALTVKADKVVTPEAPAAAQSAAA